MSLIDNFEARPAPEDVQLSVEEERTLHLICCAEELIAKARAGEITQSLDHQTLRILGSPTLRQYIELESLNTGL